MTIFTVVSKDPGSYGVDLHVSYTDAETAAAFIAAKTSIRANSDHRFFWVEETELVT